MDFNPYKVLNVDQAADQEFITNAYRFMSKKYHPDINKAPDAAARMRDINRAYDMLKDASERRKVDEQLAREASTSSRASNSSSSGYTGYAGTRPNSGYTNYAGSRPSSSASSGSGPNNPFEGIWENLRKSGRDTAARSRTTTAREEPKPTPPSDKTLYLYKKSLVDDVNRKTLKISVYYESARGNKICEIYSSAPDAKNRVIAGTVYFRAEELYDFVLAIEEAVKAFDYTSSPMEVLADHVIYWRRIVQGTSKTFLGIEIIKKNRADAKEALLLIGEKGSSEGVAAPQTAKQIQQLSRIMSEALTQMRA